MPSDSLAKMASRCEHSLQLGGIRTGTLDYPNPNGGQSCRVAHVNTGSGLRLTVALDRGGDLVEASFNGVNLAFLTQNDYKPPSHSYHREADWLASWPGGLLTTCGPGLMGEPRVEGGDVVSLHGRHSNTPAAVLEVTNHDLAAGRDEMRIVMETRDTRMFGPAIVVRRTLQFRLGQPLIELEDVVTNRDDVPCRHGLLYHVNLGYPLVDTGARLVYGGVAQGYCMYEGYDVGALESLKAIPAPDERFCGANEGVIIVEPPIDDQGWAHAGLINERRSIGLAISYDAAAMPRLANWQHFGPRGSYVTALEPFSGSIFGVARDEHPLADLQLAPGESRTYRLKISVATDAAAIAELRQYDRPLTR